MKFLWLVLFISPLTFGNQTKQITNLVKVEVKTEDNIVCNDTNVLFYADSLCKVLNIPYDIVYNIGLNESNWKCIKGKYEDYGDLQVIPTTFNYYYDKLNLQNGKTRYNYLVVGMTYLRYQYDRYGSWRKARFAYGRGHWKPSHVVDSFGVVVSNWTKMESKFMNRYDWNKYR